MTQSSLPNYRLFKTVYQQTPVSKTYNILNQTSNTRWRTKVFSLQKIAQHNMQQVLQYNRQILTFIKEKYDNTIYFQCSFEKQNKQYFIYEMWNQRLSAYIDQSTQQKEGATQPKGQTKINKQEVKQIIQDIILSFCDVYAENYMIINLKPQNIVRVFNSQTNSNAWRIDSFVFDYTLYGLNKKCQYQFDYQWASNQEKQLKDSLTDKQKDQQIVWYIGIMALRLIYGSSYKINKKFKDSDINLPQLKQKCLPQIFQIIIKCVKANQKDRIQLKDLLNLTIFNKVQILKEVRQKFTSGAELRISRSTILKNSVLKKSSIRKSTAIKLTESNYPSKQSNTIKNKLSAKQIPYKMSEATAQRLFNQLRWDLQKCLYFAEIKEYTQTNACNQQMSKQDKILIRYIYLKIAYQNYSLFKKHLQQSFQYKQFRESINSKDLYKELVEAMKQNQNSEEKSIINKTKSYEQKIKQLNAKNLKLLSNNQQIVAQCKKWINSQSFDIQKLLDFFSIISGRFYTSLKKILDSTSGGIKSSGGIKKRALCFFILSSYILFIRIEPRNQLNILDELLKDDFFLYKQETLNGSLHVKFIDSSSQYIRLCEYTIKGEQTKLILNSQQILNKYFKVNTDSIKQDKFIQNKSNKRPSISISNISSNKNLLTVK